jgi:hypothetical protein
MSSQSEYYIEPEPPMEQVTVGGSTAVLAHPLLGTQGTQKLIAVLERLPEVLAGLEEEERAELAWQRVEDRLWSTRLDQDEVRLNLRGAVAELTVSGHRWVPAGTGARLEGAVMARAEQRLNRLFALAVALEVSERLGNYVQHRAPLDHRVGAQRGRVQVRVVETERNRVALRVTTPIRFQVRAA